MLAFDGKPLILATILDITESKRAYDAIQASNRDLGILNLIATTLNNTMDINDKMGIALKGALDFLEADAGAIYMLGRGNESEMRLKSSVCRTQAGNDIKLRPVIPSSFPMDSTCYNCNTPGCPDIFENGRVSVCVPLKVKDKPAGIMAIYHSGEVDKEKCYALLGIGSQLSI